MSAEWAWLRLVESGRPIARSRQARSLWERFRGLMLSPPLPSGEALWISGCAAVHTAFLRASVDLLFLRGHEVVRVCRAVPPWRVVNCRGADSVVELAAGEAERIGVVAGQWLEVASEAPRGAPAT
jgi:uncharacterized membrane protein (UPF0127 family)